MKRFSLLIMLVVGMAFSQSGKYSWKAELDDDVKKIQPIFNGKYIFLWADEYAWLYENATGKKIWSVEIDEYDENAVHQVVNDSLYFVANEDTLYCYHMTGSKVLWKRQYRGVEQDRFSGLHKTDTLLILSYKNLDLGINLSTGEEHWRVQVEYQTSLPEKGTVNSILLPLVNKYFVFTKNNECELISMESGKKLLSLPFSEPQSDLVNLKRAWYYVTPDQKFASFLIGRNFIVVNIELNKMIGQIPVKINDQYNVLMPTSIGCTAVADDKIVHIRYDNGKVTQIPGDIDDRKSIVVTITDSAAVMILGLPDKIAGWNLDSGKIMWQTALKFQPGNGFVQQLVATDTNNVVMTYVDPSEDLKLYLMSIDVMTGKINYRTQVAHSEESLAKRNLPLAPIGSVDDQSGLSFGYDHIGFDYSVSVADGFAKFVIRTTGEMLDPITKKRGGEGFVLIDIELGQIISKNYLRLADGMSFDGGLSAIAPVKTYGSVLILPGNKQLTALDANYGTLKWMLIEQDLNGSFVFETAMVDTVLYVRTGGIQKNIEYDAKKDKIKEKTVWEEDDFTILAVDTASGKVLWKKVFDVDPGRNFHGYTIAGNVYKNLLLYYSDEDFLYALSLEPERKGMLRWKFEFSDSGVGSLDFSDLYQRSTYWAGERMMESVPGEHRDEMFFLKHTVAAAETIITSLSKILHVDYLPGAEKLFLFGDDGISAVNSSTGRREWLYEWDYSEKAIQYRPMKLKGYIFYCIDGEAVVLNSANGMVVSNTDVDKENPIFIMPDKSSVVIVAGDEVTGIVIP